MSHESTVIVESHPSAATLYASGALTADAVLRVNVKVEQLPSHVRALCVDLRAVRTVDDRALRALHLALAVWRAARRGMSRVQLPERAVTSPVAFGLPHTPRSAARISVANVRNPMDVCVPRLA